MAEGAPDASDVFLSYAREDEARARELATALAHGGFSVFWDHEIPPGEIWDRYIGQALKAAKCVVVAWSSHSIKSEWVMDEASVGKERKVLVPVLLDAVEPPFPFARIQAVVLVGWQAGQPSPAFDRLLRAVAIKIRGPADPGIHPAAPGEQSDGVCDTERLAVPNVHPPAPVIQVVRQALIERQRSHRIPAGRTRPLIAAASDGLDKYCDKINAKGPTAHWPFSDNDTVAIDKRFTAPGIYIEGRIRKVDGIVQGVAAANKAIELIAGAHVQVQNVPALQSSEFTVIGHARVHDLSATRQTLVGHDQFLRTGFSIDVSSEGELIASLYDEGGLAHRLIGAGRVAPQKTFFFGLSIGFAGTNLYLNGVLVASNPAITSVGNRNMEVVQFGGSGTYTATALQGIIDEFAWFPRQLTGPEIADLSSPL